MKTAMSHLSYAVHSECGVFIVASFHQQDLQGLMGRVLGLGWTVASCPHATRGSFWCKQQTCILKHLCVHVCVRVWGGGGGQVCVCITKLIVVHLLVLQQSLTMISSLAFIHLWRTLICR